MWDVTYLQMKDRVVARYMANWTKSLRDVHSLDAEFLAVDPSSIDFFLSNRGTLIHYLADEGIRADLVELFVELSLEFSYKSNQYLRVTEADRERMEEIYRSYLMGMERVLVEKDSFESLTSGMECLVRDHFIALRHHLDRLSSVRGSSSGAEDNVFLAPAVCKEYSPRLQLAILGIDSSTLMDPVLDLGCGKSGALVHHLRSLGVNAFGVDRTVEACDYLLQADWLDLPLDAGKWGTVISHMAFSNHFVFQHLYRFGAPEEYARQYAMILASLKRGGSFWYSPGLPFVEDLLPAEKYTVARRQVLDPTSVELQSDRLTGGAYLYATRVVSS